MKMPEESRVIQVSNLALNATKDQMKTLFGFIGRIDDVVIYPELETTPATSRMCYVKFEYAEDVGVSLHLSNTVFIDRALTVLPVIDGKIPDEKTALAALTNPASINSSGPEVDEIQRTIYVSNLSASITPEQLLELFGTQAGEVKYVRMAGDEGFGSRAAFIEFTEQGSVMHALSLTGQTLGDCLVRVSPANTAITKPANTVGATSKELEQAMKKVNEAQPLISAVLDPDRKSRSRSRSRRSRSHRSRSRRRSRSRSRKRSRSRSRHSRRRSRSRSRRRSRSPKRRRSRSRGRRSRSKSRDRRQRSKSRSPKSSKSRRSRSQEKTKKMSSKSRDNTPAESSRGTRKHDEKKTSKDSEKDRKQSSRQRSRSPKMSSSRKRSRSRSSSPPRFATKGRDERRRSRERSRERSDRSRSTRDEAKEPARQRSRGQNGLEGDSERHSSRGSDRESKSYAAKRSREVDQEESDVDDEPKLARNEDNASEGDASHTEDED